MKLHQLLLCVLLTSFERQAVVVAQRPNSQSICDYYATKRYGENNSTSQLLLIQSIVAYAYAGGGGLANAPQGSDGIFNRGKLGDSDVYLRPWFDGSKPTTNLNDQPVGINWLDGGSTDVFYKFLSGSTNSIIMSNSTNQYRLFTHWFTAFGYIYGCSQVSKFPKTANSAPVSVAYAHKYMDLNQTHIGYFINQLTIASKYFGFSDDDAKTLDTYMNSRYNVRCAPAINGQLYSICFAKECPLAAPNPDCDSYNNLKPSNNNTTSSSTTSTSTRRGSTATSVPTSTVTSVVSDPAPAPALSSGAIAGIAIGGAAVLLLAFGMWLYFRHKGKQQQPVIISPPIIPTKGYASPASPQPYYSPHAGSGVYNNTHFSTSGTHHDAYLQHQRESSNMGWSPHLQELGDARAESVRENTSPSPGFPHSQLHPYPYSQGQMNVTEIGGPDTDMSQGWTTNPHPPLGRHTPTPRQE